MKQKATKLLMPVIVLLLATSLYGDDITPTNIWVDYYSYNTTINGEPIPVGTIIEAFDPDGVKCGQRIAHLPGNYKYMPVYGNNGDTPKDEGCEHFDEVTFKINGIVAQTFGPGSEIWTVDIGRRDLMDLAISQTYGVDLPTPDDDDAQPGDTLTYFFSVTNIGSGTDLFTITDEATNGWEIVLVDFPVEDFDTVLAENQTYILAAEEITVDINLEIPELAARGETSDLTLTVVSETHPATEVSTTVTSTAGSYEFIIYGEPVQHGKIGTTVYHEFHVRNDGNLPDQFGISYWNTKDWVINEPTIPPGDIASGDSLLITFGVEIPLDTELFDEDTLTVTVWSLKGLTTEDSIKAVTVADEPAAVNETDYYIPGAFKLNQNYPNPFNPETVISFNLERSGDIKLKVIDIMGRQVTTLYQGYLPAGEHQYRWGGVDASGTSVASGIYFYRLSFSGEVIARKMTLLK